MLNVEQIWQIYKYLILAFSWKNVLLLLENDYRLLNMIFYYDEKGGWKFIWLLRRFKNLFWFVSLVLKNSKFHDCWQKGDMPQPNSPYLTCLQLLNKITAICRPWVLFSRLGFPFFFDTLCTKILYSDNMKLLGSYSW